MADPTPPIRHTQLTIDVTRYAAPCRPQNEGQNDGRNGGRAVRVVDRAVNMSTSAAPTRAGSGRPLLVLLAAGAGTRFGGSTHKLNARLARDPASVGSPNGVSTVAGRAIANALAAGIGDVAIVTGAAELEELADRGLRDRVTVIDNPRWAEGQSTSLTAAVRYARGGGYDAVVIGLADQPAIHPDAWRRVATSDAMIAFATYDGERGHPVRLSHHIWDELPSTGDEGARTLVRLRRAEAEAIPCSGSAADIDTLEDLTTWQKHSSTSSP